MTPRGQDGPPEKLLEQPVTSSELNTWWAEVSGFSLEHRKVSHLLARKVLALPGLGATFTTELAPGCESSEKGYAHK